VDRVAGDAVVRVFFAVELTAALREEARCAADALRDRVGAESSSGSNSELEVRWTRSEGWHVTLRFLGDIAASRLGELLAAAGESLTGLAPFELRLGAGLALPPRRVRVLALEVIPHEPLVAVAAALERVAVACGFEPEGRAFAPHLTLGRVKRGRLRASELAKVAATGAAVQTVRDVVLLRSELLRAGARYTPLERIALGANVHP
jgi:2'-5' RNA ligase